ncbi:ABC transporter ATP-binding protein, partial [Aquipuribacter sp. MA13-6]
MTESPTTTGATAPTGGSTVIGRDDHLRGAENAVLRVDELVAGYLPGVNILNGTDLYAAPGELVGIIGPNGAG